jgi:hypothetical protein
VVAEVPLEGQVHAELRSGIISVSKVGGAGEPSGRGDARRHQPRAARRAAELTARDSSASRPAARAAPVREPSRELRRERSKETAAGVGVGANGGAGERRGLGTGGGWGKGREPSGESKSSSKGSKGSRAPHGGGEAPARGPGKDEEGVSLVLAVSGVDLSVQRYDLPRDVAPRASLRDVRLSLLRCMRRRAERPFEDAPNSPRTAADGEGARGGQLARDVLSGAHFYTGVVADVAAVDLSACLHNVSGEALQRILYPFLFVQAAGAGGPRADADGAPAPPAAGAEAEAGHDAGGAAGRPAAGGAAAREDAALGARVPSVLNVVLNVRCVAADVRVLRDVRLNMENAQGCYATLSQFSRPVRPGGQQGERDGRELTQTDLSLRVHKSAWATRKLRPSGERLSQAKFFFPEIRAAGGVITRHQSGDSLGAGADTVATLFSPKPFRARLAAGAQAPGDALHVTDVRVIFSVQQTTNEVRAEMLNFLLEMQRTMSREIDEFLHSAEEWASKFGRSQRLRAAQGGARFNFHLTFLLMGIRLIFRAPGASLMLDTGFFTLQVAGKPRESTRPPPPFLQTHFLDMSRLRKLATSRLRDKQRRARSPCQTQHRQTLTCFAPAESAGFMRTSSASGPDSRARGLVSPPATRLPASLPLGLPERLTARTWRRRAKSGAGRRCSGRSASRVCRSPCAPRTSAPAAASRLARRGGGRSAGRGCSRICART